MKSYDSDLPIILGLAGEAATGKTTTANGLAPAARIKSGKDGGIQWDHFYFAMPLYQMANARQTIEGAMAHDRMCYAIHNTLLEVFGTSPLHGAPAYDHLVEMVLEIAEFPCPKEGKPRSFLQHVGTEICRAYDPNCWVNWMKQKIMKENALWRLENIPKVEYVLDDVDGDLIDLEQDLKYGVVISDVRFVNEAEYVANHPNGILIKLTASDSVLYDRQMDRDGVAMTATQKAHASEQGVSQIPEEWFYKVLDTTEMSVKDQVYAVHNIAAEFAGLEPALQGA